jgi:hypothetical protein
LDGELITPRAAEEGAVQEEESSHVEDPEADRLAKRAAEAVANKQKAAAHLLGDPSSLTTIRRKNMLLGNYPRDLYYTGMTEEEKRLRNDLSIPNPSHDELYKRLRGVDSTFTEVCVHIYIYMGACVYVTIFQKIPFSYMVGLVFVLLLRLFFFLFLSFLFTTC